MKKKSDKKLNRIREKKTKINEKKKEKIGSKTNQGEVLTV